MLRTVQRPHTGRAQFVAAIGMCGIAGIVAIEPRARGAVDVRRVAETMTAALAHRGPDAGGIWCDDKGALAMGHRRLAIVDLSPRGTQPMRRSSGQLVITFNGEIYNFRKLRASLGSYGVSFESATDTETILAAVEVWGLDEALRRMEGAFAFCIWDTEKRVVHFARDRVGQKPLYLCVADKHLLFSSELRSLLASGMTSGRASHEAVAAYLSYGYVPEPLAMFEGVTKLAPGTSLTLEIATTSALPAQALLKEAKRYWRLPAEHDPDCFVGTVEQSVDAIDALLTEVVAEQLECDVPIGVFLSGGIDSSIVAAKAQQVSRRRISAYTIRFPHAQFDESMHAARVAAHLKMDHRIIELGASELLSCVQAEAPNLDEPTSNPSYFPLQLMARHARRDVTVALSGDGGDEIFSGYNRYLALQRLFRVRELPLVRRASNATIRRLLQHQRLLHPLQRLLASAIPQANLWVNLERLQRFFLAETRGEAYRSAMQALPQADLVGLLGVEPKLTTSSAFNGNANALRGMMLDDVAMYLPGDNLAKVDRASMREALEVRLPLLDKRLIEFSSSLPNEHLLAGKQTKRVLRLLLRRYLPEHLIERPKMGFSVPIESWLQGGLKSWAEMSLRSNALQEWAGLSEAAISSLWNEFLRTRGGRNAKTVWALAILSEWMGERPGLACGTQR